MMRLNTQNKFYLLHIVNHTIAAIGLYLWFASDASYLWLLLGFVSYLYAGIVGVNVSLHRYFSHKAFKTGPIRERILLWSTIWTSLGSPAMWCSIHRMHHATSDTDRDPHSPKNAGILGSWFTVWPMVKISKRYIAPFLKTEEQRFVHKNYFLISALIIIVLCLIDIKLAAFLYCFPAIGCYHGAAAIGVLPHLTGKAQLGYRRYDIKDLSHNNWLAAILSLGEGWHNNHHANPGRWYQGERWWEIDPPAFMIKYVFASEKLTKK